MHNINMSNNHTEWVRTFSGKAAEKLVINVFSHIERSSKDAGYDIRKNISITFLAYFIGSLVYKTLIEKPKDIKDAVEMQKYVSDNFASIKLGIQEAISHGFEAAVHNFTKKDLEYYCVIKPTPEMKNKSIN